MVSYGDVVLGRLSKLKGDVVRMNTLYLLIIKKWIYAFMFRWWHYGWCYTQKTLKISKI